MGKKFLTIASSRQKYRVFLDDILTAYKQIHRASPRIPHFRQEEESVTDIEFKT
jgi:hypothetical protein